MLAITLGIICKYWTKYYCHAPYKNGSAFQAALDPHKKHINIFRGVDFKGWLNGGFPNPRPNSHPALAPHLLTAAITRPDNPDVEGNDQTAGYNATGASIDQFIAQRFKANPDTATALEYIHAGVKTKTKQYSRQVYREANKPMFPQINGVTLLNQIFDGSSTGGGASPESIKRLAEKRSVLNYSKSEINAVMALLSNDDKQKMEAHLEGVFELERQLEFEENNTGGIQCTPPNLRASNSNSIEDVRYGIDGENMLDLITQAFVCDRTRVATLQWANAADDTIFKSKGIAMSHHEATHGGTSGAFNSELKSNVRNMAAQWYAERFAYVVDKMSKINDTNGKTLLDNTLIVWTTEHSNDGEHSRRNIPFITAGSAGGTIKTGNYFDFSSNRRGHGDLYATFAQAVGLSNVERFGGMPESQDGVIPGILI